MFVPVKTKDGKALMPMHAARARKLVKRGEATPYFNNGIYCIRLNKEPSDQKTQEIAVGVDPGSKKEGFTVFSPLEVGKQWFYSEVRKQWTLFTLQGWETKEIRDRLGLKKSSQKLTETFDAHCVDSWCLAYQTIGGVGSVDNTEILCISPIPIHRRQLHRQNPQKGGKRPRYGGTRCLGGVSKNTLVKHVKKGLLRVTGYQKGCLTLSEVNSSKQVVLTAKPDTYQILRRLNFKYR
jgi:hypothetical protein